MRGKMCLKTDTNYTHTDGNRSNLRALLTSMHNCLNWHLWFITVIIYH